MKHFMRSHTNPPPAFSESPVKVKRKAAALPSSSSDSSASEEANTSRRKATQPQKNAYSGKQGGRQALKAIDPNAGKGQVKGKADKGDKVGKVKVKTHRSVNCERASWPKTECK
jgi:hypothetical protein